MLNLEPKQLNINSIVIQWSKPSFDGNHPVDQWRVTVRLTDGALVDVHAPIP